MSGVPDERGIGKIKGIEVEFLEEKWAPVTRATVIS